MTRRPIGRVRPWLLAVTSVLAACAAPVGQPGEPELGPPLEWRVGLAEHVALWYHGMAYTAARVGADTAAQPEAPPAPPAAPADTLPPVPLYRPGYVDSMTAVKRRAGVFPTELDRRADEFARAFESEAAYAALHFLPLYFRDADALFGAIRIWHQAGGDPRRVGGSAAPAVAFLSSLFPSARQRSVVAAWAEVLQAESRAFYHAHWQEQQPALAALATAVQREWEPLADSLADFLLYAQLRGGELLLVPALGAEGRIVTRGVQRPRVAIQTPPADRPRDALWPFLHELAYPLAAETVREYLAPVRIRELGETAVTSRAAVRTGALLLDRVAPGYASDYRRFFLAAAGRDMADPEAAFDRVFSVPPELEEGLRELVRKALAGI